MLYCFPGCIVPVMSQTKFDLLYERSDELQAQVAKWEATFKPLCDAEPSLKRLEAAAPRHEDLFQRNQITKNVAAVSQKFKIISL